MFAYRVGTPGWKVAAMFGIPLKAVVEVFYDKEAQVYVASCEDFLPTFGIATEAESIDRLKERLQGLFEEALCETFKKKEPFKVTPSFELVAGF